MAMMKSSPTSLRNEDAPTPSARAVLKSATSVSAEKKPITDAVTIIGEMSVRHFAQFDAEK